MLTMNFQHSFIKKLLTFIHLYEETNIRPLRRLDRFFAVATLIAGLFALVNSLALKLTDQQVYFMVGMVTIFYFLEEITSKWEWRMAGCSLSGNNAVWLWISSKTLKNIKRRLTKANSRRCSFVYGPLSIATFSFGAAAFVGVYVLDSAATIVERFAIGFMICYTIEKISSEFAWRRIGKEYGTASESIVEQVEQVKHKIKEREFIVVDTELRAFLERSQRIQDEGNVRADTIVHVDFGGVANDPNKLKPSAIDMLIRTNLWLAEKILYAGGAKLSEPSARSTARWFSESWNDALTEIDTSSNQLKFSFYRVMEAISVVRCYGYFARVWDSLGFGAISTEEGCICGSSNCQCKSNTKNSGD